MNVRMTTLRLFLVILFLDGQFGIPLDSIFDEDMIISGLLSAVGPFKDSNSALVVKEPGSPCHGLHGRFEWMQNPKQRLHSLFRKHLDFNEEPCQLRIKPSKLPLQTGMLGKREKEASLYNWNSFGLRYGKKIKEGEKK